MQNPKKIILIDDDADIRLSTSFLLTNNGFEVKQVDSPVVGIELIKTEHFDLVLLDMNYSRDTTSGEEGLDCLNKIREIDASLPIVAITAWAEVDLIVKAIQCGANDFIEKPWDNHRLLQVIRQSLNLGKLEKRNQKLRQQVDEYEKPFKLVAHSPAMKSLINRLDEVAKTQATILLTGENGTGKSTLAQYVHHLYNKQKSTIDSQFKEGNLVSINMGAIPESLFESEMFGHTKGAFTGAQQARIGRFGLAEQGTLFLDEVTNIPTASQSKLLRVLESGHYERVGSSVTETANVRLISASNGNFEQLIGDGLFRQDLYFRLNTVELQVPALRERRLDIPELADLILADHCLRYNRAVVTLLPCALEQLCDYPFPGNLRELSHILERVVLFCKQSAVSAEQLIKNCMPGVVLAPATQTNVKALSGTNLPLMTIEQAERELIDKALRQSKGQTQEAAQLLGISKSAIYRRLEKYKIIAKNYL